MPSPIVPRRTVDSIDGTTTTTTTTTFDDFFDTLSPLNQRWFGSSIDASSVSAVPGLHPVQGHQGTSMDYFDPADSPKLGGRWNASGYITTSQQQQHQSNSGSIVDYGMLYPPSRATTPGFGNVFLPGSAGSSHQQPLVVRSSSFGRRVEAEGVDQRPHEFEVFAEPHQDHAQHSRHQNHAHEQNSPHHNGFAPTPYNSWQEHFHPPTAVVGGRANLQHQQGNQHQQQHQHQQQQQLPFGVAAPQPQRPHQQMEAYHANFSNYGGMFDGGDHGELSSSSSRSSLTSGSGSLAGEDDFMADSNPAYDQTSLVIAAAAAAAAAAFEGEVGEVDREFMPYEEIRLLPQSQSSTYAQQSQHAQQFQMHLQQHQQLMQQIQEQHLQQQQQQMQQMHYQQQRSQGGFSTPTMPNSEPVGASLLRLPVAPRTVGKDADDGSASRESKRHLRQNSEEDSLGLGPAAAGYMPPALPLVAGASVPAPREGAPLEEIWSGFWQRFRDGQYQVTVGWHRDVDPPAQCRQPSCVMCELGVSPGLRVVTDGRWRSIVALMMRIVLDSRDRAIKNGHPYSTEEQARIEGGWVGLHRDLYPFFEDHWEMVVGLHRSKQPKWRNALQNTLSHNQPFFVSGKGVHPLGTWRLGDEAQLRLPPGISFY